MEALGNREREGTGPLDMRTCWFPVKTHMIYRFGVKSNKCKEADVLSELCVLFWPRELHQRLAHKLFPWHQVPSGLPNPIGGGICLPYYAFLFPTPFHWRPHQDVKSNPQFRFQPFFLSLVDCSRETAHRWSSPHPCPSPLTWGQLQFAPKAIKALDQKDFLSSSVYLAPNIWVISRYAGIFEW